MHYFSLPFLSRVAAHLHQNATYHLAHKSIPSVNGAVKVGCGDNASKPACTLAGNPQQVLSASFIAGSCMRWEGVTGAFSNALQLAVCRTTCGAARQCPPTHSAVLTFSGRSCNASQGSQPHSIKACTVAVRA